jgi:hypothetical protein
MEVALFIIFLLAAFFGIPACQWARNGRIRFAAALTIINILFVIWLKNGVNNELSDGKENGSVVVGMLFAVPLMVPIMNLIVVFIYNKFIRKRKA